MNTLLDDIRQLSAHSAYEEALSLLDLWLEEHPNDTEAQILKVEISLEARQNYAYIGQTLLQFSHWNCENRDRLQQRSSDLAWKMIDEGRECLKGRSPTDALDYFDNAAALLPGDPVIPLAAGLAVLRLTVPLEAAASFGSSPFEDVKGRLRPSPWASAVEKYLRLTIQKTIPSDRPYEVAVTALVRQWLAQDKLAQEGLSLLMSVAKPIPSTVELMWEFSARVSVLILETIATLLRIGAAEKAETLIKSCIKAKFSSAKLYLYEAERLSDQREEMLAAAPASALKAYTKALRLAQATTQSMLDPQAARTLLLAAQGVQVKCSHCNKATRPNSTTCIFCGLSLQVRQLAMDSYPNTPDRVLAHLGYAEMLARSGKHTLALEYWQSAIDLLPDEHRALKPILALREKLGGKRIQQTHEPNGRLIELLALKENDAEMVIGVNRVNETSPDDWIALPVGQRAALVRRLMAGGHLKLAQETLTAAFADQPERKSAADLRARLEHIVEQRIVESVETAEGMIAAERPEAAIVLTTQALELRHDARLYLTRGAARLATGADLPALEDFYVAASVTDEVQRYRARKAAALVLERHWNISGARTILNLLDAGDRDVIRAHARLDRRERGEPFVLIEDAADGVMEDTLTRRALPPYYHGYFALAVREVGFPGVNSEVWIHKLLAANYEFVQVLGALRDVMGDAIFVLRTISHPHRQIPERGTVTVALLVRVSAEKEYACRARALQLWTDIHAILPLAQENIYIFEPVVDEEELQGLLTPFKVVHAAEVVHREFASEGVYSVDPFTVGTLDLHNLHWALLRQSAPSMISIHLKPTNLLPWERSLTAGRPSGGASANDAYDPLQPVAPNGELLNQHLARVQLWEKLQMQHAQLNTLRFAYLMRVYVAGSAGTSQLLPEMAAAALFGPLRDGGQSGGCEIVRAGNPQDADVIVRNLSALDVESWAQDAHTGERLARFRYLVGEGEAAGFFRLPIPTVEGVPGMVSLEGKPVVPPVGMPEEGIRLGVSVARTRGVPMPITQAEDDRRRHLYVVGKTGMGKSTLLMTLILQDIEAGRGVFLLDPHGDLCEDVLARIPAHRADDVILLDPSDAERPVGLNILDAESEADQHRVVNEFIGLLIRMYDPHNQAIVGPIFQQNVRNAMLAAMSLPDGTLIDVYRLLSDTQYIKRVLPYIKDPLVRNYWEEIAARVEGSASNSWKAELLPYLLSKFSRFVEDSTLRRMIGQPRTSIQWNKIMDEGKILLVNLAKGRIGQENAQFIGSLVLSSVLQAAFRRGELPAARRREFYLYIDEVQNYATPMLATMLSEGRKFGVILTIANQFLHQLDNGIREAVFGNVGSLVAFRVGTQDAPALAPEFFPVFSAGDLLNLPQFTACVKLLIDGVAARPFSMRTLPAMAAPDIARAEQIRELSRQRYGTDIARVQQDILKKF